MPPRITYAQVERTFEQVRAILTAKTGRRYDLEAYAPGGTTLYRIVDEKGEHPVESYWQGAQAAYYGLWGIIELTRHLERYDKAHGAHPLLRFQAGING